MAGSAAIAEDDQRFRRIFVNEEINDAGIYAFNVYIRGIPSIITIDDFLPWSSYSPYFAGIGLDGSLWAPLLEKVWAKTNVNYENTIGGDPAEPMEFFTNSPTKSFDIVDLNADALW